MNSLARPAAPRQSTLAELCKLLGICADLQGQPPNLRFHHLRLRTGDCLYQTGEPFRHLYALNSGFLKAVLDLPDGNEQVVGFSLRGALLGIDGICSRSHASSAIALGDADLIQIPAQVLRQLARTCPGFSRGLYSAISRELTRTRPAISRTGLTTRGRVGRLLLDLADRFADMGYSAAEFNLPMTRAEMASYLGMAQETVSRALLELEAKGLIQLDQRTIRIVDRERLRALKRLPRLRPFNCD
ncbi:Crp/Fnr family transcriptional regulator [Duganella caerulea]|uniref:Crp/Fnr family transcriptional regulator n=1 Tax=Duganella caerulea TaxID=2885762 RepID=UPI004037A967